MNTSTEVMVLLGFLLLLLYLCMHHRYSYWKRKNVANILPYPSLGNLKDIVLQKRNGSDHFAYLYNHPKARYQAVVGLYNFLTPTLMIRDLNVIKTILVRDFNKFSNRFDPVRDGLSWNNLFMKNPRWKDPRSKLTPFFNSSKLKMMFPLISEVGNKLNDFLLSLSEEQSIQNLRELTTDVIATVAFGIKANSLKDSNADFRRHGRMLTTFTPARAIEVVSIFFFPQLVTNLRSKQFSKICSQFYRKTITHVMNDREKSGRMRKDLIDILLSLERSDDYDGNTDFLVAQAALFFLAGFHTSASAMTFALYELSKNQEVQKKLRNEIKENLTKTNGTITYEMIAEMEYLRMVYDETFRMYPPYLDKQYLLSEGEKEYPLNPYSDFAIPHGMPVSIPFFAIQRDPKYFPDPLMFDPERFSKQNKANILPFSYILFETGPRSWVGERMAKMQSMVGLVNILKNHLVIPCNKTLPEMILDSSALVTQEKGEVYVQFVKDFLLN